MLLGCKSYALRYIFILVLSNVLNPRNHQMKIITN